MLRLPRDSASVKTFRFSSTFLQLLMSPLVVKVTIPDIPRAFFLKTSCCGWDSRPTIALSFSPWPTLRTGVVHSFNTRVLLKELGNGQAILAVALHSNVKGFETAVDQEAIKGRGDGANCVLDEKELLLQSITLDDNETHDHVWVTVHVFGGRVHHNIRSQVKWTLIVGRQECVVDNHNDIFVVIVYQSRDF